MNENQPQQSTRNRKGNPSPTSCLKCGKTPFCTVEGIAECECGTRYGDSTMMGNTTIDYVFVPGRGLAPSKEVALGMARKKADPKLNPVARMWRASVDERTNEQTAGELLRLRQVEQSRAARLAEQRNELHQKEAAMRRRVQAAKQARQAAEAQAE